MSGTKPPLKNRTGEKNPFDDGFGQSNIKNNSKQFAIAHMHQKADKERNIKRRGLNSSNDDPIPQMKGWTHSSHGDRNPNSQL